MVSNRKRPKTESECLVGGRDWAALTQSRPSSTRTGYPRSKPSPSTSILCGAAGSLRTRFAGTVPSAGLSLRSIEDWDGFTATSEPAFFFFNKAVQSVLPTSLTHSSATHFYERSSRGARARCARSINRLTQPLSPLRFAPSPHTHQVTAASSIDHKPGPANQPIKHAPHRYDAPPPPPRASPALHLLGGAYNVPHPVVDLKRQAAHPISQPPTIPPAGRGRARWRQGLDGGISVGQPRDGLFLRLPGHGLHRAQLPQAQAGADSLLGLTWLVVD